MNFILIVLLFAAVAVCGKQVCRRNEIWTDCDKECSDAIKRCENLNIRVFCKPQGCTPGCICRRGYYRDDNDRCIKANDCPQILKCDRNEVYDACSELCGEGTCDRPKSFYCGGGSGECTPKCHCKDGYVRDYDNKCIRLDQCKSKACGKNQEYSECNIYSNQINRCENLLKLEEFENTWCGSGCICKSGYFRNKDNKCVKREDCPPLLDCDSNEEYHTCSDRCVEATCENKEEKYCGGGCKPKCHCKKGYVRNYDQTCIKVDKCPARNPCKQPIVAGSCKGAFTRYGYDSNTGKCIKFSYGGCDGNENRFRSLEQCEITCENKPNCRKSKHEVYSECGAKCQATCSMPDFPESCEEECTPGCVCEEGYIRDSSNKCIRQKYCPINYK